MKPRCGMAWGCRICRAEGKDVLASNTIVGVAESVFQLGNKRLAVELLA